MKPEAMDELRYQLHAALSREQEARGLLDEAADWMDDDGCDCGTPGDVPCVLCRVRAFLAKSPAPQAETPSGCPSGPHVHEVFRDGVKEGEIQCERHAFVWCSEPKDCGETCHFNVDHSVGGLVRYLRCGKPESDPAHAVVRGLVVDQPHPPIAPDSVHAPELPKELYPEVCTHGVAFSAWCFDCTGEPATTPPHAVPAKEARMCGGCGGSEVMVECVNCEAPYCRECAAWCNHSHTEKQEEPPRAKDHLPDCNRMWDVTCPCPPAPEDAETLLEECRGEFRLLLIHHAEVSSTGCKPYLRAEALLARLSARRQER